MHLLHLFCTAPLHHVHLLFYQIYRCFLETRDISFSICSGSFKMYSLAGVFVTLHHCFSSALSSHFGAMLNIFKWEISTQAQLPSEWGSFLLFQWLVTISTGTAGATWHFLLHQWGFMLFPLNLKAIHVGTVCKVGMSPVCIFIISVVSYQIEKKGVKASPKANWRQDAQAYPVGTP